MNNRFQPSILKSFRRRRNANKSAPASNNLALFDDDGKIHKDVYLHAVRDSEYPNFPRVIGIEFWFTDHSSSVEQQDELIGRALKAMTRIRADQSEPWKLAYSGMPPIEYEDHAMTCLVEFRSPGFIDSIRLNVFKGSLKVSIPHPSQWERAGLNWIRDRTSCRSRDVPTSAPWLPAGIRDFDAQKGNQSTSAIGGASCAK